MSFSCRKGKLDRCFNRLDRPSEESQPGQFPSLNWIAQPLQVPCLLFTGQVQTARKTNFKIIYQPIIMIFSINCRNIPINNCMRGPIGAIVGQHVGPMWATHMGPIWFCLRDKTGPHLGSSLIYWANPPTSHAFSTGIQLGSPLI